jgi:HK97 family phage major capsid protein
LGGYLAPAEFSREVDKNIVQFSPIRQAARVGATASGSVIIPRRTGAPTAHWVGETETRTETGSTYGQVEIPVEEIAAYVDVSNKLLEDAAVDIAAEVAFDLAEEFGRIEGVAFVSGDGVKKPSGFMSDANISYTPGGDASAIKADGLIDLYYALKPFYRQRGTWMMNGSTIAAVRKLKDPATGAYLWQPALAAGTPETLLGRPIVEAVDMPDVSGNAFPIAFGDFASGYRIYDRVALSLLRDPYSVATSGLTRFHARRGNPQAQNQRVLIGGIRNARHDQQYSGEARHLAGFRRGQHGAGWTDHQPSRL